MLRSPHAATAFKNSAVALLFCLFSTSALYSQRLIEGITQAVDGSPIPFANVYLGPSKRSGTVSNLEGRFRITASPKDTLNISHIGFVAQSIPVSSIPAEKQFVIALKEFATELGEVIIMPDDSLRQLLSKAFSRIEVNYPTSGTLITGFYREANQLLPEESFLYFAESMIRHYKPSYTNKEFGPVMILEGTKSELPSRHSYSNVDFFGGLYGPQSRDFVKERAEFINPDHFDLYDYRISGTMIDEGSEGYKIVFTPRAGAHYKGEFYLVKNSLAYAGGRYELTGLGIKRHNQQFPFSSFKFTSRRYVVQYKEIGKKWNILLAFLEGDGKSGKFEIRYTSEHVSTDFEPATQNPIKESEAVPYTGIYTQQTEKLSDWKEPGVLIRLAALDSAVTFLLKRDELKLKSAEPGIEAQQANKAGSKSPNKKIYKHLSRLSTSIYSGLVPLDVTAGTTSIDYGSIFSIQKENDQRQAVPTLGYEFRYTTPLRISYAISFFGSLSGTFLANYVSFGTEWSKTIAGWKKPVYLQPGLSVFYSSVYQNLGVTSASGEFQFGGKTIPQGDIKVFAGEERYGLSPSLALGFRFRPRVSVYVKVSFPGSLFDKDMIAVQPYPGNIFTTKARLDASAEGLQISLNSVETTSSGTSSQNFGPFPWIGLRIGI